MPQVVNTVVNITTGEPVVMRDANISNKEQKCLLDANIHVKFPDLPQTKL